MEMTRQMICSAVVMTAVLLGATAQESNRTRHDWRHYDLGTTPHRPHELPPELERRCVALVRGLGLLYGAIDLIERRLRA